MANTDLYAVLEVGHDATPEELKRSYRKLARQYHPDTNDDPQAEARFKEVSQAYEILSDPERRANYDRFGSDVGAGGNPFGAGSVQDIFDMFFGGLGARNLTDDVRGVRRRGRRATSAQFDSRPDGDLDALHALQRHGITNRLAVPGLSRRRSSQRVDDPDDPGAGGRRRRINDAPQ